MSCHTDSSSGSEWLIGLAMSKFMKMISWLLSLFGGHYFRRIFVSKIIAIMFLLMCWVSKNKWIKLIQKCESPKSRPDSSDYLCYEYERHQCHREWKSKFLRSKSILSDVFKINIRGNWYGSCIIFSQLMKFFHY